MDYDVVNTSVRRHILRRVPVTPLHHLRHLAGVIVFIISLPWIGFGQRFGGENPPFPPYPGAVIASPPSNNSPLLLRLEAPPLQLR